MKSLAKNSIYNIIYQLLSLIFPLISSMYVARIIMEDGVGKVAYAQNIASYFTAIALLGFPSYGIREIAKTKDNPFKCNRTFFELFFINAMSTTFATIAYIVTILNINDFRKELPLYLCVGITVWLNYANIDWFYQGKEEYGYITVRSLSIKFISLVALFIFVKQKDDYIIYALISSCGTACNYILNLFHARKYIRLNFEKLNIRKHISSLLILGIVTFLGNIYNKVDITMLGIMTNDAVVGYYSNAHKIILIAVSCCIAVTTVFMPRLSYYFQEDKRALNSLVNSGLKFLIFIIVPATIGVAMLASEVMVIFYGESFAPAGKTLSLFAPILLICPIGDLLCYQLLISAGKEKKRIYTSFWATVVNISLNAILIPKWQQNGAVVASIISEIIVNGLLLPDILRIVKIDIELKYIGKVVVAAAIMLAGILGLKRIVGGRLAYVLYASLFGMFLYFGTSVILKNEILKMICDRIRKK